MTRFIKLTTLSALVGRRSDNVHRDLLRFIKGHTLPLEPILPSVEAGPHGRPITNPTIWKDLAEAYAYRAGWAEGVAVKQYFLTLEGQTVTEQGVAEPITEIAHKPISDEPVAPSNTPAEVHWEPVAEADSSEAEPRLAEALAAGR
jgi:hypothetical protein